LALLFQGAQALPVDYFIQEIRFVGNNKSRPETLLRELGFIKGTAVSVDEIDRGRRMIMSLGLFTNVETRLEPLELGHRLWVYVDEKHFFLPLPILSITGDGDWIYGASSQADNLFGLNQQLKFTLRKKTYRQADIKWEDRLQARYSLPRVAGSSFDLGIVFGLERAVLDEQRDAEAGQYTRHVTTSRLTASRWLHTAGPSHGWRISAAVQQKLYEHKHLSGDPGLFFDAGVSSLITRIEKRTVVESAVQRTGQHYGYELQKGIRRLELDRQHEQHFVFYRHYGNLGQPGGANIHTHLRAGACSRSIFGDPCFSLGGATTIRGIRRNAAEGNAFALVNLQLLVPLTPERALRGIVFLDVGTTADTPAKIATAGAKFGVGVGLVWKLQSFVRTDVRAEMAHGFGDDGDNRIYAATSHLF